ncbi:hypothetical protein [Paracraurococcus lichenis]|uniref:DUF4142 domain-containing protein n=1 Tax=Paracraurococcus lichenis TaxID=3064888 RepID=A0ABT9DS93_9PROT|nr:hypothetical protein [Paracraurococcus sp. LOR1-02]MDO9706767.1 hypothetical protein [Paracraurococcus sp. LOR1-02]
MRRVLAVTAAALLAWAPAQVLAQSPPAQSQQETARQAAPATGPAADLQAYALVLQGAEQRLAQAKERHAAGRTSSQEGAFSQERIDLMQTLRGAWHDMQRVPPAFAETEAYQSAQQRMRQEFGEVGPDRSLSKEKADTAAQDALQVLSDLRGQVVSAAGQAGAPMAAPAVQGGGANAGGATPPPGQR